MIHPFKNKVKIGYPDPVEIPPSFKLWAVNISDDRVNRSYLTIYMYLVNFRSFTFTSIHIPERVPSIIVSTQFLMITKDELTYRRIFILR